MPTQSFRQPLLTSRRRLLGNVRLSSSTSPINTKRRPNFVRALAPSGIATNQHSFAQPHSNLSITSRNLSSYQQQPFPSKKMALVLGSNGALGSTISSYLRTHHDCLVIGADVQFQEGHNGENHEHVDAFLPLNFNSPDLGAELNAGIKTLYDEDDEDDEFILDAIICANGGFAMDSDESENDTMTIHEKMMQMNYHPIVAASTLLPEYMTNKQGLFLIIGATAALAPGAPNMSAYGSSKAAAHYFLQSVGGMTSTSLMSASHKKKFKSLRKNNEYLDTMTAVGILPSMLDTENNRMNMPDENFDLWTKPVDVAKEIGKWVDRPEFRPHSGSLVKVLTKRVGEDYNTEFHLSL